MLFQVCPLCPEVASPYSEQAEDPVLLLNEPKDCGRWLALPLWPLCPWVLCVDTSGTVISEKASHCNTWKFDCVAEIRDLFFHSVYAPVGSSMVHQRKAWSRCITGFNTVGICWLVVMFCSLVVQLTCLAFFMIDSGTW